MANDLDFDELDRAVSGYMQKRKRGSSASTSVAAADQAIPGVPSQVPVQTKPESVPLLPAEPVSNEKPVPSTPQSAPAIRLEPRHSLNYRNDIIHDIAPPRPLPPHVGRKLDPGNPTSPVVESDRPGKIEVPPDHEPETDVQKEHSNPRLSFFKRNQPSKPPEATDRYEPPRKVMVEEAGAAATPAAEMSEGSISDALAEDLGHEKKDFEEQKSQAAEKLSTDVPSGSSEPVEKPSKAESESGTDGGGESLDEPDRLLPEGPHSAASPNVPQVPREKSDHSVDLFDTTQYHTPLSPAVAKGTRSRSLAWLWTLVAVIVVAGAAVAYFFLVHKK